MKKFFSLILILSVIMPCVLMLSACGHEHAFEQTWTFNDTHHWHASTCEHSNEKSDYKEHIDENLDDVCDVCSHGIEAFIGDLRYPSLEGAISAIQSREAVGTIILHDDVDLVTAIEIYSSVEINLNGKKLSVSQDIYGNGVFHVVEGGNLTINGDGIVDGVGQNDWNIVIFADGGDVTINGGIYTNIGAQDFEHNDADHFDVIYAKKGSKVVINGGTFKGQTPKWILNTHNTDIGTFEVRGGTFINFNPSQADTEPSGLKNWVVEGYKVKEDKGVYSVIAD